MLSGFSITVNPVFLNFAKKPLTEEKIEMINIIYNVLSKEKNINNLTMQPGDANITFADISKAQKLINYQPKTNFKKGIEKFTIWYKKTHVL